MLNKDYKYAECYLVGRDEDGNNYKNGIYGKIADIRPHAIKLWFGDGNKAWFKLEDIVSLQLRNKLFTFTYFFGDKKFSFDVKMFSDNQAAKVKQLITLKSREDWVDVTSELH